MINYVYSAKNNSFFPVELLGDYSKWDLTDKIEVDNDLAAEFMSDAPTGKVRRAGKNGLPFWDDIPEKTDDEKKAAVEIEKSRLNDVIAQEIAVWQTKLLMGRKLSDVEAASLNAWLDYSDAVSAVDATNPAWPTPPED